ncbi:MAG: alpha/beta fold hydrolase [Planctomycetia bacterium]|nr:alpha/beta fold hydrolase [Planctomycetia bacterium]
MTDVFTPIPVFRSGHHQTIVGYLLRRWQRALQATLHRLVLPDGDCLHIHDSIPTSWQPGQPIIMIVHGLGGSHTSGSVLRLAWEFFRHRFRTVRINLRGSGESLPEAKKPYHAGCSADIVHVLETVNKWSPTSPLFLIGLSLGGNIVLKLAGEVEQQQFPQLKKIYAVSPPVDLEKCSQLLSLPKNAVYEKRFVAELIEMAQQRARFHQQQLPELSRSLTLRQFDDIYTAPSIGYSGVEEYYEKASSRHVLSRITIPTHILSAEDDPMIDPIPIRESPRSRSVTIQLTPFGGHLGFISRPGKGGWYWLEKQLLQQITSTLQNEGSL